MVDDKKVDKRKEEAEKETAKDELDPEDEDRPLTDEEEIKALKLELERRSFVLKALNRQREKAQRHIKALHSYNEWKDIAQMVFGKLAELEGTHTHTIEPTNTHHGGRNKKCSSFTYTIYIEHVFSRRLIPLSSLCSVLFVDPFPCLSVPSFLFRWWLWWGAFYLRVSL